MDFKPLQHLTQLAVKEVFPGGMIPLDACGAVLALDKLAAEIKARPYPDTCELLNRSVRVGNLLLSRLTWGAQDWLNRALEVWSEDDYLRNVAVVYAFACAREPEAFAEFSNVRDYGARLRAWAQTITAGIDELDAAIQELRFTSQLPAPKTTDHADTGIGCVFSMLMQEYGKDFHYWLWTATQAEVETAFIAMEEKRDAEINATYRAEHKSAHPETWEARAHRVFLKAAREFKEQFKAVPL